MTSSLLKKCEPLFKILVQDHRCTPSMVPSSGLNLPAHSTHFPNLASVRSSANSMVAGIASTIYSSVTLSSVTLTSTGRNAHQTTLPPQTLSGQLDDPSIISADVGSTAEPLELSLSTRLTPLSLGLMGIPSTLEPLQYPNMMQCSDVRNNGVAISDSTVLQAYYDRFDNESNSDSNNSYVEISDIIPESLEGML